jgi:hypothetical protein
MRISQSLFVIGAAVAPLAIIIPGIAMADQPPAPPPPTTPTYICDTITGFDPAYFGVGNCTPYGGMQASGIIPAGTAYKVTPRNGDPLGNIQSFSCSGGNADTPTTISPKRCTPIGTPIAASLAPSPVPFIPPGAPSPAPVPAK